MSAFPVKNFRQALEDTKSLQTKLSKNFIVECKKHNMIWIDGITEEFYRIFSTKQNLKLKVNAMYAIQYFIELGEYPIFTLFEVYILPVILEIALFNSPDQNYESTSQYFLSQGYSANTPNMKQLSHNYITLAQDFIFNCASIKPYRTFESSEMNEPSQYKKSALKLNKNKVKQRQYNDQVQHKIQVSREEFLKNLSKFDNDSQYYVSYYMKKVQQYIIQGTKYKETLDFKKIMKYGDVFLTSQAIGHCCEAMENNNFQFKKNSLLLIHDFVIWGDIEAIMMINYAQYIEEIFNRIAEVKGELSLNVGEEIYPEIYGQKQAKKGFYIEFLKCLQTWAMALPKTNFDGTKSSTEEDQEFSPIFLFYIKLKNERQFKFPDNPNLPKHKKQLEESLVVNKERNNLIMRQLEQNAEDTMSLSKKSIKPINKFEKYKSKNSVIKQQRESQFITSSEIQKYIKSAQSMLEDLLQKIESNNMNGAQNILQRLNDFCSHFESKLEFIDESIDEENLEQLYRQGIDRIDRINCISDHFQSYKQEKINIMKLQELIRYELTKTISQNVQSRYLDDYRSRKSKKSMSKSFGNMSQNLRHSNNNRSIELRNFSHDRYKIPIQQSRHQIVSIAENKVQRESSSEVSRSTNKNKKQSFHSHSKASSQEQGQANGSYDFGDQNYGFQQVPVQHNFQQTHSKRSLNSSRVSKQSSLHKAQRRSSIKRESKNLNIYTAQQQVQRRNSSKVSFSHSQKSQSNSQRSIEKQEVVESEKESHVKKSNTSKKQSDKRQNVTNGRISNSRNSQGDFTKSKKLTQNSESFVIASVNMKKLNQISNTPSDQESHQNRSVNEKQRLQSRPPLNRSHQTNENPHRILESADPRELNSFNVTNIIGFSKPPPSSVNRISSIQQRKFKFQMLNSQDREIFEDESSKDEPNERHQKIKSEVKEEENPGFGIVFKNKSNLKNSNPQNYQKINKNFDTHEQLRSNLSPNRPGSHTSKENSKIKQNKPIRDLRNEEQSRSPFTERSNSSGLRRSKQQSNRKEPQTNNIYTSPTFPKRENFHRMESFGDNSLERSNASRRSLRKSQRNSFSKQNIRKGEINGQQNMNPDVRRSPRNSQINLNNGQRKSQRNSQIEVNQQKNMYASKTKEEFNQSSFAQSSQDTPRILQRSKDYYHNEQNSQEIPPSKQSIYLQKNTSPKHEKISFAHSSKHNILSKLVISEKDEKQEFDRSNLTPSQVPKSRTGTVQRFDKQSSNFSKEKVKVKQIVSGQNSKVLYPQYETQKKNGSSQKKIQYLANKQMEEIRILKQRLEKIENESRHFMDFQRSTVKSPEIPRYAVTPRSPKFRDQNSSLSIEAKERLSFVNNSGYISPQTKRNFDLNSSFSRQYLITPEGKLIKKKNYERYFDQLKCIQRQSVKNMKKHLLKNKELIQKNENIEIGVTVLRQRNRLKIIYFITPEKPIERLLIQIQPSRKLKIKCSESQIYDLQSKKQYKVYVNCEIGQFPYILPKIQFVYKNDKKTFYLGQGSAAIVPETKVELFLPVFFIKFIEITQISSPQLSSLLQGRQVYRTEQFPLNPKIIKRPHQINDYIPNLTLLSQSTALTIYCGKASFFDHKFIFKINFKMNHFVYVQALSIESSQKQRLCQNILEWFLVCMEELFIKEMTFAQRSKLQQ